ncbi:MAG: hypothetical protein K0M40_06080 [Prolixibacteraceae bacterium]|nr:hypothetical protein [Prolixibacteraceae bacterium]
MSNVGIEPAPESLTVKFFTFIVSGADSNFKRNKARQMKDITLKPLLSLRKFNRSGKGTLIVISILTSIDLEKKRKVNLPDQMIK